MWLYKKYGLSMYHYPYNNVYKYLKLKNKRNLINILNIIDCIVYVF